MNAADDSKVIGEKNAELLAVKCRLDLRSVMEDFEGLYVAKGTRKSVRENNWDHILRTNQRRNGMPLLERHWIDLAGLQVYIPLTC